MSNDDLASDLISTLTDFAKSVNRIKAQYLQNKGCWTAFTTYKGYDYQEYGTSEREARDKLGRTLAVITRKS